MRARSLPRLALAALAAGVLATVAPAPHARAAVAVADQSNTVGSYVTGSQSPSSPLANAIGQSFTPTLAAMNVATFSLRTAGIVASDAVTLNVYAGAGFGGTLLATSTAVTFTNADFATIEFDLPGVLALTPGSVYTLGLTLGVHGYLSGAYGGNNPYAGGDLYNNGADASFYDAVFAEGVTSTSLLPTAVPEPSTWVLLGASGIILTFRIMRHRSRAQLAA